MKKISTIVPVFNEEKNVPLLYEALKEVSVILTDYEFEFIFVNDGSRDNSWNALKEVAEKDTRAIVIDFSRNFGKEIALTAGVQNCTGDCAIFMDADMQHPPALIPEFVRKWEAGAEVVASLRKSTEKKSFIKDIGSKCFYGFMNFASHDVLTPNATDFKLIDRKVINELVRFTEHKRLFRGLIEWMGFHTEYIEFVAPKRANGVATYSLRSLVSLAINSITSFSLWPLKFIGYLGIIVSAVSFFLLAFMCIQKWGFKHNIFSSIAYVIVTNTFVLGVVLIGLGMLALYIGQIYGEVINRPLYVVREKYSKKES